MSRIATYGSDTKATMGSNPRRTTETGFRQWRLQPRL